MYYKLGTLDIYLREAFNRDRTCMDVLDVNFELKRPAAAFIGITRTVASME